MNPLTREELRTKLMTKYGLHSDAVDEIMALVETDKLNELKNIARFYMDYSLSSETKLEAVPIKVLRERINQLESRVSTPKPPTNGSLNHGEKIMDSTNHTNRGGTLCFQQL